MSSQTFAQKTGETIAARSNEADEQAEDVISDFSQISSARSVFETHWQETAELVLPQNRGLFTFGNIVTPGEKRTDRQVDTTAMRALSVFVAILDSLLTPEDTLWHILGHPDSDLMKNRQVRLWLEQATNILFTERYMPTAGFSDQNQKVWQSTGAFGTGVLFSDEYYGPGGEEGLRYRNIGLQEAYLKDNHQGIVDTCIRAFTLTPRQAYQRWGEALPETILAKVKDNKASEGIYGSSPRFLHAVRPRSDFDPGRNDDKGKYWESVYVSWDAKCVLSTGAFECFPYAVARYDVAPNEVYGRGPVMSVLPEVKTLNLIKKTLLKQAHLRVSPPTLTADDGLLDAFSLKPGSITKGGVSADGKLLVQPYQVGDVQEGAEMIERETIAIKDALLVTLMEILDEPKEMTATQVIERTREKATLMAPPLSRLASTYLGMGLIPREMDLLAKMGKLPPMPPQLQRARDHYRVVYTSPLARAKKAEEASGVLRTVESMLNIVNITQDPSVLDFLNWDVIGPELAAINAVPERWVHGGDEIAQIRQDRAQAQERQQQVQEAPAAAALMKAKAVQAKAGMQPNAMPRTPFPESAAA